MSRCSVPRGRYVGQFNGSATPTGVFSAPSAIAVDNSENALDPSAGDVYVVDTGHYVIDKFTLARHVSAGSSRKRRVAPRSGNWTGSRSTRRGCGVGAIKDSGEIDSFSDALGNEYLLSALFPFGVESGVRRGWLRDDLYVNSGARSSRS